MGELLRRCLRRRLVLTFSGNSYWVVASEYLPATVCGCEARRGSFFVLVVENASVNSQPISITAFALYILFIKAFSLLVMLLLAQTDVFVSATEPNGIGRSFELVPLCVACFVDR